MSLRREEFGQEVGASDYIFQLSNGTQRRVRLRLGKPYFIAGGEWACPVEIQGFEPRYPDIRGNDSMQALGLAIGLVRKRVQDFLDKGGTVRFVDGTECPPDLLWAELGH